MRIKLPQHWIDYLLTQPETGMGFQRVAVVLKSGRVLAPSVVFNAQELEAPDSPSLLAEDIAEIRLES